MDQRAKANKAIRSASVSGEAHGPVACQIPVSCPCNCLRNCPLRFHQGSIRTRPGRSGGTLAASRSARLPVSPCLKSVISLGEFMASGIVKWFNDAKGFGFIKPDDGEEELFAHFSAIQMSGFKTLKEGQRVSFDVVQGPKGKQATNIQDAAQ